MYYKAGGIARRLLRYAAKPTTWFDGISFYRTLDRSRLLTSVAHVFNERGEGVIGKGGQAQLNKDDKTPHLSEADAHALLKKAIRVYRQGHRQGQREFLPDVSRYVRPAPASVHDLPGEDTGAQLAREMLSLSKLNWNNTQFDGCERITIRAARRVGDILKGVADSGKVQPTFRFFV